MLNRRTRRHSEDGQGLVEFALVAPIFFLIFFAVVQFGMIMGAQDGLDNAVREATRYAATVPISNTADAGACGSAGSAAGMTYARLLSDMAQRVPAYSQANVVPCGSGTSVTYCTKQNPDSTYSIWVRITAQYKHSLFVPLIGAIVDRLDGTADNKLLAKATEEMRVETFTLASGTNGGLTVCS